MSGPAATPPHKPSAPLPVGEPHIVSRYDEELTRLNQAIARMGGLAETQLAAAIQAMLHQDEALAAKVIRTDVTVDEAEDTVNAMVVRLLALRQPLADDLRIIISALKTAGALERVADHAASTAHRVALLNQYTTVPAIKTVGRLGWLVIELLKESLDAFTARDTDRAYAVWQRDGEVDELYSSLFRELLTYMMEDPRHITPSTHLLFIAKNLERVGDQATNMAEATWFIVTGQRLTEARPKRDTSATVAPALPPLG